VQTFDAASVADMWDVRKEEGGNVYGRLRVLDISIKFKRDWVYWLCHCDPELGGCNTLKFVAGITLRSRHGATSCGCRRREAQRDNIRKAIEWRKAKKAARCFTNA